MAKKSFFKEVVRAVIHANSSWASPTGEGITFSCGNCNYTICFGKYRSCVGKNVFDKLGHKISNVVNPFIWAEVTKDYKAGDESVVVSDCFYGPKALLLQVRASRGMFRH